MMVCDLFKNRPKAHSYIVVSYSPAAMAPRKPVTVVEEVEPKGKKTED